MRNYAFVKMMMLATLACVLSQSANAQAATAPVANAVANMVTSRSAEALTTDALDVTINLEAGSQQVSTPTPRASYITLEAIAVNNKAFSYRPSVGFRGSGNFSLPAGFYLREEVETATEFKVAPPVSGEGRYFASRTTVEKDIATPSTDIAVSALAGFDVGHYGNDLYGKTVARIRAGLAARWNDAGSGIPHVRVSASAIVPISDQNKLWGFKTTADGFYSFPHSFFGLTGGAEVAVANAKESFTSRRAWGSTYNVHAGVFVNLSAIAGY